VTRRRVFVARVGSWRVRFVVYPTRKAFQRACRVGSRVTGSYRAHARPRRRRLLGTIHLPDSADLGTVAHESLHAVFDWIKVRGFDRPLEIAHEECAARFAGRLMRRYVRDALEVYDATVTPEFADAPRGRRSVRPRGK